MGSVYAYVCVCVCVCVCVKDCHKFSPGKFCRIDVVFKIALLLVLVVVEERYELAVILLFLNHKLAVTW